MCFQTNKFRGIGKEIQVLARKRVKISEFSQNLYMNKSTKRIQSDLQKNELGEMILARKTVKISELSQFSK